MFILARYGLGGSLRIAWAQHEIERLEVAGYLQKPFRLKELLNTISGLLSLSRCHTELCNGVQREGAQLSPALA
jgi:DNA-binding response OmpR family regulator